MTYYNAWENIFSPVIEMVPTGIPTMPFAPQITNVIYRNSQMIAFDFATQVFDFGFWGEAGYFYTEDVASNDPFIKNPYIQYVVGTDYTFPGDIQVNVQFFQEIVTNIESDSEQETEDEQFSRLGFSIPLKQALTCRIGKSFGEGDANSIDVFVLYDLEKGKLEQKKQEMHDSQKEISWGSQIRSYVFNPYSMVKDHRTNVDVGDVNRVMDGYIDPFIDAYLKMK